MYNKELQVLLLRRLVMREEEEGGRGRGGGGKMRGVWPLRESEGSGGKRGRFSVCARVLNVRLIIILYVCVCVCVCWVGGWAGVYQM